MAGPVLPSFRIVLSTRSCSVSKQAWRGFFLQASQQATSEGRVIRLPNGAIVAGLENHSPLSRVAIVCNAGSRFEKPDQAGICHSLRNASNLGTKNATGRHTDSRTLQSSRQPEMTTLMLGLWNPSVPVLCHWETLLSQRSGSRGICSRWAAI